MKLWYCEVCGNLLDAVEYSGVRPVCCGKGMTELKAGTSDGASEKHVPVYSCQALDCKSPDGQASDPCLKQIEVNVGQEPHPMTADHYIKWIALETSKGLTRYLLNPGDIPRTFLTLCASEEIISVYAYCNIHGLYTST